VAILNRINPNVTPAGFPTGHGIFIGAQERGQNNTTLEGNTTSNNEQNGIFLFVANQGRGTFNVVNNVSNNNQRNGIEFNVGLNPDPPPPNAIILPLPPPGTLQGVANISNNTVNGNVGTGPAGQEGGGIIVIGANNATLQATIQGNFVNDNATFRAPGQSGFAGIGMVSLDNSQILATVRFNTILNTAAPSFNAQTAPGSTSKICLKLTLNSADAGNLSQGGPYPLLIGRSSGAMFQADTSGNSGPPVIASGLSVSMLGDCPVPP
jgi:parallel beta-helix repeat protein